MSSLQLFNYNSQQVRTTIIDGEPWFVLADLCAAVEISNSRDAASRVHKADVGQADIRSGGQVRKMTVVNESGMYEVAFRSEKPAAKDFRRWVTSVVLPSIRQTGSYSVPAVQQESDDLVLARGLSIAMERLSAAQGIIAAKDEEIQELAPKAAYADTIRAKGDVHSMQRASNLLEDEGFRFTGRNTLYQWLRDHHWVGQNDRSPLQSAITAGYLKRKYYTDYEPSTLVTAKGLAKIHELMTKERERERRAGFRELPATKASLEPKKRKRRSLSPVA